MSTSYVEYASSQYELITSFNVSSAASCALIVASVAARSALRSFATDTLPSPRPSGCFTEICACDVMLYASSSVGVEPLPAPGELAAVIADSVSRMLYSVCWCWRPTSTESEPPVGRLHPRPSVLLSVSCSTIEYGGASTWSEGPGGGGPAGARGARAGGRRAGAAV